jgi:serine/threonine protein kinase
MEEYLPAFVDPVTIRTNRITYESEMYSLGVILYNMVTGVPPFWGESPKEIYEKSNSKDYPNMGFSMAFDKEIQRLLYEEGKK